MLSHGDGISGRNAGYSSRRRRSDLSSSRKRDRAVRGGNRENLRALLDAYPFPARRGAEDVEEPWQLLHPARSHAARAQGIFHQVPAFIGPVSEAAQLYFRGP